MNQSQSRRLMRLLQLPTAPFRESHIARFATDFLTRNQIAHFSDPIGNIVVGAKDAKHFRALARSSGREPLRLFIAHMDHPGFHGVRWKSKSTLIAKWHGGSPTKHLKNAAVWIGDETGYVGKGIIAAARLHKAGYAMTDVTIRVADGKLSMRDAAGLYGGFAFRAPVFKLGRCLYTKAADDLVGVFAVLETALAMRRSRNAPFLGLLTRAEEVGFVGAVAHFDLGWLERARRKILCVSLETSRTLPGADIGKGPVVRLGDRRTVFDADALKVFADLAKQTLPRRHQRRIMDGGSCEATAATAWGLPAIGISVPLGNYHNEGFQGGPDCKGRRGPAPEFVHVDDVAGLLKLCRALMRPRLAWHDAWKTQRRRLRANLGRYRALLKRSQFRQGNDPC